MSKQVKITECPRDAMQGIKPWIATEKKIAYINSLLACGFDVVDFGSFVSEKAMPQMRDTPEVLLGLNLEGSRSKLLAIVANLRGAETAVQYDQVNLLGFPFSISETFQQRNTNSGIEASLQRVEEIQRLCTQHGKQLIIYISMAFGNPYGDPWHPEIAIHWCEKLYSQLGIAHIALSDTVGIATPQTISHLFSSLIPALPQVAFGAHLHTTPDTWREKVEAAWKAGCYRFDGAIQGFGGCPMASDQLTGNMPTEHLLRFFDEEKVTHRINKTAFDHATKMAASTFPSH